MARLDKPANLQKITTLGNDINGLIGFRFNVVRLYVGVMLVLAAFIVWSGIRTAEQTQQYHQDYKTLQDMKKQERMLKVEHQRLLIEQQTFSATPQIASRAVTELGMFSPALSDKIIVQPAATNDQGAAQ